LFQAFDVAVSVLPRLCCIDAGPCVARQLGSGRGLV
jgi:hypothetical protein